MQGTASPFLEPGGAAIGHPSQMLLSGTGAPNEDSDADQWQNDTDNCPFKYNPLQEDSGGLGSTTKDLIGDICQCGDGTGDGARDRRSNDVDRDARDPDRRGAGGRRARASRAARRCSVAGDDDCDIQDAAVLELARAAQRQRSDAHRGLHQRDAGRRDEED